MAKPNRFDSNLIVIGAGSAGLISSLIAATVRARVTLIERGAMGGDCLNTGCVPSKTLIRSAKVAQTLRDAERFGIGAVEPEVDFRAVMARVHAAIAREIVDSGNPLAPPACVISGGETTVTLRGDGKGGRNQEFVLAAAIDISGLEPLVILSGGTDGSDGPTDAAGAICDGQTISKAKKKGMNAMGYLSKNDSYSFFEPLNDLLITGPTKTNVMDLRIILVGDS